jgi:hypothetical protein
MQKIPAKSAYSPLLWLCCCVVLLSGCAQLEWHKTGASDEARERDAAECTAQARPAGLKQVPMLYPHTPGLPTNRQNRAYPSQDSRLDSERFMAEQDALRECMRQRGYELKKHQNTEH